MKIETTITAERALSLADARELEEFSHEEKRSVPDFITCLIQEGLERRRAARSSTKKGARK